MTKQIFKQAYFRIRTKRKQKDTIFRILFHDKRKLLSLYNAISGKHYTNPEQLEIVTLENAIYMGIKNDLAFLIDFNLYLYEHQSTVNPNMPYRFLQYVAEEYERIIAGKDIYGGKLIRLPAPHFIVFYNGTAKQPERHILKLSDAYGGLQGDVQLELQVIVLNINEGFNEELKEQCQMLKEYMQYVNRVRRYAKFMSIDDAVDQAVDECIKEGILSDFLLANKAEVKRMSIYEYNDKMTKRVIHENAKAEGKAEGKADAVLVVLEMFGPIPNDMREAIMQQANMDTLNLWLQSAVKAKNLEEWKDLVGWME